MTDAPSDADLARWAREHRPVPVIVGTKTHGGEVEYRDRCPRCRQPHPCLPSRLLALVAAQADELMLAETCARIAAGRADRAEAAVARVRALCDEEEQRSSRWVVRNIRAALDGDPTGPATSKPEFHRQHPRRLGAVMTTPDAIRPEWIEAGARALARVQNPNCSADWPNVCAMCDCFRDVAGQSMAGYEREHAAAVIAAVCGDIAEAARETTPGQKELGDMTVTRTRCLALLVDELRAARDRGDFDAAKRLSSVEPKLEFTMRDREGASAPFLDGPNQ